MSCVAHLPCLLGNPNCFVATEDAGAQPRVIQNLTLIVKP